MTKVHILIDEDDAKRLKAAFDDGKLKELGIENIEFPSQIKKQWVDSTLEKRGSLENKSGLNRPGSSD